jgi:hypothetical protein
MQIHKHMHIHADEFIPFMHSDMGMFADLRTIRKRRKDTSKENDQSYTTSDGRTVSIQVHLPDSNGGTLASHVHTSRARVPQNQIPTDLGLRLRQPVNDVTGFFHGRDAAKSPSVLSGVKNDAPRTETQTQTDEKKNGDEQEKDYKPSAANNKKTASQRYVCMRALCMCTGVSSYTFFCICV